MDTVVGLLIVAAIMYALFLGGRHVVRALQHRRGLTPEQKAHHHELRGAEKALKRATKAYTGRVADAEKRLRAAQAPKPIASHGGVRLYEDRIELPDGMRQLTPTVRADVDTAGNFAQKHRSTLTRMGVGTLAAGPIGLLIGAAAKKTTDKDTRELYLMVQSDTWASIVKANPDAGLQIRQLAQQVNVAAQQVEAAKAQRQQTIALAEQTLTEARANRRDVEEAERALEATRLKAPDPSPLALTQSTRADG